MTAESSCFTSFVLDVLRSDALRARLQANEADNIVTALGAGWIDTTTAITWANEFGLLDVIGVSSDISIAST